MRPVAAALVAAAALAVGGCSLSDDDQPAGSPKPRAGTDQPRAPSRAAEPDEARTIRAWNAALNAGDFEKAASYFADGAIVEQVVEVRLRDRRDAIRFNRSLPCRSEVTDVDDEGRTTLVAFRLLPGRGGGCRGGGAARVRFRVRDGKFEEWRQLDEQDGPPGQIASGPAGADRGGLSPDRGAAA